MNHTAAQLAQLERRTSDAPKGRWRLSDGGTSVTAHDGRIAAGLPQPLAAYLVAVQPRRVWALVDEIKYLRRELRRAQKKADSDK